MYIAFSLFPHDFNFPVEYKEVHWETAKAELVLSVNDNAHNVVQGIWNQTRDRNKEILVSSNVAIKRMRARRFN